MKFFSKLKQKLQAFKNKMKNVWNKFVSWFKKDKDEEKVEEVKEVVVEEPIVEEVQEVVVEEQIVEEVQEEQEVEEEVLPELDVMEEQEVEELVEATKEDIEQPTYLTKEEVKEIASQFVITRKKSIFEAAKKRTHISFKDFNKAFNLALKEIENERNYSSKEELLNEMETEFKKFARC